MDKKNIDDLLKKIEEKIQELEQKESPSELLKTVLFKKGIISNIDDISDEEIDNLFDILDKEINK